MKKKLSFILGTILVFSAVYGFIEYNNYVLNEESKTGVMIENNIDLPEFNGIFTPAKNK